MFGASMRRTGTLKRESQERDENPRPFPGSMRRPPSAAASDGQAHIVPHTADEHALNDVESEEVRGWGWFELSALQAVCMMQVCTPVQSLCARHVQSLYVDAPCVVLSSPLCMSV
jgi:hypothetical protein